MPRNVSAPMTPSARGRAWPSNRCDAAAVPTGHQDAAAERLDEPRGDQLVERSGRGPASSDRREDDQRAQEQPARAPQVGQATGERHRDDVHQQVAVDDPRRLAQLGEASSRARSTMIDGSATAVIISSRPARNTPVPKTASSTSAARRSIAGVYAAASFGPAAATTPQSDDNAVITAGHPPMTACASPTGHRPGGQSVGVDKGQCAASINTVDINRR